MPTAAEIPIRTCRRLGAGPLASVAVALAIGLAGCAQSSSRGWAQTAPTVAQERIESVDAPAGAGLVASSAARGLDGRTAAP